MSRARDLSKLGNINVLSADDVSNEVGIATTVPRSTLDVRGEIKVGTAIQAGSAGVVTATSFSGSGANLTGIANTATVVSTATTTGLLNVTGTTDSTSSTTGSVTIAGGVGIAKNVYIGAGLSVAGTLTYEDVTSVDSVGLITAKSGVNVSGGQLTVGSGITMGIAGVATFSGTSDVHLLDNVQLNVGDGSDLAIYHDATNSRIHNSTGDLIFRTEDQYGFYNAAGNATLATFTVGASVELYEDNTKRLETTTAGVNVTGTVIADGFTAYDNEHLKLGTNNDLDLFHSGTDSFIRNAVNNLNINAGNSAQNVYINLNENVAGVTSERAASFNKNGSVDLYYDNSQKFATTNEGIEVTGFTSTTAGMGITGGLFEGAFIKAGKLSDNKTLGISTANVFYFTTQETTTATPDIRWNDTITLSNKMAVGDVASVTVITTAAAGGYSANWTIDGNAVTEEWVGGSAPSEGGSDGLDIYSLTIIKTGTGTGDSGFKVIGNLTNAT